MLRSDRHADKKLKKVAGATDGRSRTGWEKKIPHRCAERGWFIMSGSDGRGTLTGCIIWAPKNKIYHIVLAQIVPDQKAA